jgi:hypothetical protein
LFSPILKLGMAWQCASVISATQQRDHKFKANLGKVSETLPQKQNKNKRAAGVGRVVEHLLRLTEALGSVLSATKTK